MHTGRVPLCNKKCQLSVESFLFCRKRFRRTGPATLESGERASLRRLGDTPVRERLGGGEVSAQHWEKNTAEEQHRWRKSRFWWWTMTKVCSTSSDCTWRHKTMSHFSRR